MGVDWGWGWGARGRAAAERALRPGAMAGRRSRGAWEALLRRRPRAGWPWVARGVKASKRVGSWAGGMRGPWSETERRQPRGSVSAEMRTVPEGEYLMALPRRFWRARVTS